MREIICECGHFIDAHDQLRCDFCDCVNLPSDIAAAELAELKARAEKAEAALEHLFQACEDLPLSEMNRLEMEINEASNALRQGEKE